MRAMGSKVQLKREKREGKGEEERSMGGAGKDG